MDVTPEMLKKGQEAWSRFWAAGGPDEVLSDDFVRALLEHVLNDKPLPDWNH